MKIISASIIPMNLPFVEAFQHHLAARSHSDSLVVKLMTDAGVCGFGEGVPRAYVTGETREACIRHIQHELLPAIFGVDLAGLDPLHAIDGINQLIPSFAPTGNTTWHASRCAVELALLDCYFLARNASIAEALPPAAHSVTYSAVLGTGTIESVLAKARRCKQAGFRWVKLKVNGPADTQLVAQIRDILGPDISLRLDANAAFDPPAALEFLNRIAPYSIACVEQPIPRGDIDALARLQQQSPVPLMADESLITLDDARELIAHKAVRYFNLRISKCGGIGRTLTIAKLAQAAGIGCVLGCQVGESAILSAAGRHLAAHLRDLCFAEGSYGTHLLVEDISSEPVMFGAGGKADTLPGTGLGVAVREDLLRRYAESWIDIRGDQT